DERPPLSLTSDKSTECYRNWWPDRPMVELVNRSIELLDELAEATGNAFALNRNGYLFATATAAGAAALERQARATTALGAGELRVHRGRPDDPVWSEPDWDRPRPTADGADLFLDPAAIRRRFPGLAADVVAALHARRCGWLSAQQLGMVWLEQARERGARLIEGRVTGVEVVAGRVAAVRVARGAGGTVERIPTRHFVDAAGPFAGDGAAMVGVELPLFHELHRKVFFDDERRLLPRASPLVCWNDPVTVDWSDEERAGLEEDPETRGLVGELPAGVHFRPEGGREGHHAILLWNYHADPTERVFPIPEDPLHVPVVLRGVARVAPAFVAYLERGRAPYVDGGYYTKTRDNRPLIGPLADPATGRAVEGAWMLCALSGFGIMASPAAGELLAAHLAGAALPDWSRAFLLGRYRDPAYLASIAGADAGQL
ncbi:MAG TPA: FAD-binding oxidoreductase, partial [Thermoanaerobaculia bacterium]|nr:FAD-binding oxidoreductase [Thermoanaerobaculia bacterium]